MNFFLERIKICHMQEAKRHWILSIKSEIYRFDLSVGFQVTILIQFWVYNMKNIGYPPIFYSFFFHITYFNPLISMFLSCRLQYFTSDNWNATHRTTHCIGCWSFYFPLFFKSDFSYVPVSLFFIKCQIKI